METYGHAVTRIGLSGVLLWFGVSQALSPGDWTGSLPDIALAWTGMSATTLVGLNGPVEVACGALLLIGLFTRFVAFVMGMHLVLIAASLGNSAVAIRDWGLAAACLSLVFTGPGAWAFDKPRDPRDLRI